MAFRNILLPESPERFTSVFGMGTGPSSQLWPPTPSLPALQRIIKHSQAIEGQAELASLREIAVVNEGVISITAGFGKSPAELFVDVVTDTAEDGGSQVACPNVGSAVIVATPRSHSSAPRAM